MATITHQIATVNFRPANIGYYFDQALPEEAMLVARLGYVLILGIVVAAAVAIFVVLQRSEANPPSLTLEQVIGYSKYGVIDSMSANGDTVKVHFRNDFDTKGQLGSSSHDYQTNLRSGDSLVGLLQTAGVRVNGVDGVRVTIH